MKCEIDVERLAKDMFKILADYYGSFEESWEETTEKDFWIRKARLIIKKIELHSTPEPK